MAPKEIVLPSSAKLIVNIVDFELAEQLHDAFLSALHQKGINLDLELGNISAQGINSVEDLKNVASENSALVSFIIEKVIQIIIDKNLKTILYQCMERSLYNGQKIVKEVFQPVESRKDYYHVCFHVLLENLAPFFANLGSLLSGISTPTGKSIPSLK